MLTLAYGAGCGPARGWCGCGRATIDSEQKIIRIVQSKGRKETGT